MLRPRPCRWFELVSSRDELTPLLQALAEAGAVELQTHERRAAPLLLADVAPALDRFHELARSHRAHWPAPRLDAARQVGDPAATAARALAQLEAWRGAADPLFAERERLAQAQRQLGDLSRLLDIGGGVLPAPELLAAAGPFGIEARVHLLTPHSATVERSGDVLQLSMTDQRSHETFVLHVGPRDSVAQQGDRLAALKARRIDWPTDLGGSVAQATAELAARQRAIVQRRETIDNELQALAQRHGLADALAEIALIDWLAQHGSELSASERLVWVTGWTTAPDPAALCAPLHARGLRCIVQLPPSPPGSEPPSLLANPPWVRAFEAFARLLGQPGRNEADPSLVLALVAPLLFGFMFGDVGQGAVLCITGWLLRHRAPMLRLLIPGGLMAMVFGLLFGSVFAREDLIPALWLHPLHDPVALLLAAIALGAAILLGGLALNALQAHWRHAGLGWWRSDAALVLAYGGALAAVVDARLLWLVALGAVWGAIGAAISGGRLAAVAAALAHFVEQALQLAVNTVSFARVGAFALAHAGLSVAVVGIAEASGAVGYWVVLLLGNLLILLLEGLVVGIQTTRLLLFEFFVRFLKGTGRAFKPLPPPLATQPP